MESVRKLQMKAALVLALGGLALRTSPAAASETQLCWDRCVDAVFELNCPIGQEVQCFYWTPYCPIDKVLAFCASDS